MMERVRDLINKLDTPTPYEANNMHVYELLNASAEAVENALNSVVGGGGSRSSSTSSSGLSSRSGSTNTQRPMSNPTPQYSQGSSSSTMAGALTRYRPSKNACPSRAMTKPTRC